MKIRLWKLGSLEHKIFPTDKAVQKLIDILKNSNGEFMDIVWDDGLTVQEIEVKDGDLEVISAASPTGYKAEIVITRKTNEDPQV